MSEEKFNAAHARLNELREASVKLVRPIFERLVVELDKELNAIALQRESELQPMGIPLYYDRVDTAGYPYREFPVHADPIVTGWQCRRECVRASALNVGRDNAIGAVQYLCTDESHVPFPVALSFGKIRYGQPLDIGVPGAGFDRRQATRAWEIALGLKEQGHRLGVPHGITKGLPESSADLEILEREIQAAAKALAPQSRAFRNVPRNSRPASLPELLEIVAAVNRFK
jgi:hypothetical protein